MPERSPPQVGMGLRRYVAYALSRKSSIHCGSFLCAEISRTTSSSRPARVLKIGVSGLLKPYLYSPMSTCAVSGAISDLLLRGNARVAALLELERELGSARTHDAPIHEDVHVVGPDVVEDALVVRDHEHAQLGAGQRVDALGDDLQRVDVEAGVGLVEYRELGLEHRHLQDLEALLLAAREAVVEIAAGERLVDLQHLQRSAELVAELLRGDRVVGAVGPALAVGVDGLPEEARDGHAGHGVGVLEGQEHAEARAL